ncbi:MAG: DNA alkylation repair protein [Cryobacterium sp.]|nr:DNA alkylation repair protein [Oligoflexia bacterium]
MPLETSGDGFALKTLLGTPLLKRMAASLREYYPDFDRGNFLKIADELEHLEMKSRVRRIREALRSLLPPEYPRALKIIIRSSTDPKLSGFDLWPYLDFISVYGLDDTDLSLNALKKLTPRFTAEFSIRPFLIIDPVKTLRFLQTCLKDPDEHVRRWASEGTRPRLPWGERLQKFLKDPSPGIAILEELKFDPSLYVRKSIANHLNDIAKDHPKQVLSLLRRWKSEASAQDEKKIEWITHRALRSLIKAGHVDALKLIGIAVRAPLILKNFRFLSSRISLGEALAFQFDLKLKSRREEKVVIDYVIHFLKSNGKRSPKVFKLKTIRLLGLEKVHVKKSHFVRKITTRTYFPGIQEIAIQVNGRVLHRENWILSAN